MKGKWLLIFAILGALFYWQRVWATPPRVTVLSPNRGGTLKVGQTFRINVRVSDDGLVQRVKLYFSKDRGMNWDLIEVIDVPRYSPPGSTLVEHFDWWVPDVESRECLIRADAFDDQGNIGTDVSDRVFTIEREPDTIPPRVRVVSPNGGEVWESRRTYTVRWEAVDPLNAWETSDSPDRVKINVLYTHGAMSGWAVLRRGLPNTGSFRWSIPYWPDKAYPIRGWRIKIVASDKSGNSSSDTSDNTFTVTAGDVTPPTVRVRYPNTGLEVWRIGEVRNILWVARDNVGITTVWINYKCGEGSAWRRVAYGVPNTGSYSWRIPGNVHVIPGYAGCWIKVTVRDRAGNFASDTNDHAFSIQGRVPGRTPVQVRIHSPNGGEVWRIGERRRITWTATGLWKEVSINLSRDGGRSWERLAVRRSGNSYSWRVSGPPSSHCLMEAVVYDMEGRVADRDTSDRPFGITRLKARPFIKVPHKVLHRPKSLR